MHTAPTITQRPQHPVISDLESYVATAFSGDNPEVNVGGAPNVETAERMIVAAIERRVGRRLTAHEKGNVVGMEVVLHWNQRRELLRAALADTQAALYRPGRMAS